MTCLLTTLRFLEVFRAPKKGISILGFLALHIFHITAHANLVDLKAVDGVSAAIAEKIYYFFHEKG